MSGYSVVRPARPAFRAALPWMLLEATSGSPMVLYCAPWATATGTPKAAASAVTSACSRPPVYHFQLTPWAASASAIVGAVGGGSVELFGPIGWTLPARS